MIVTDYLRRRVFGIKGNINENKGMKKIEKEEISHYYNMITKILNH